MKTCLLAVALLALTACDRNDITGPTTALNTEFTLGPGGIATVESMGVRFLHVTKDTRCPINALCVTAGQATIEVALSTLDGGRTYELNLIPSGRVTHEGLTLQFVKLQPGLIAGETIPLADYRATLKVTR